MRNFGWEGSFISMFDIGNDTLEQKYCFFTLGLELLILFIIKDYFIQKSQICFLYIIFIFFTCFTCIDFVI